MYKVFDNIDIVLVSPQIPDNIGLAARVLKNTSFRNLSVVTQSIPLKSFEVAKAARDTLEAAKVFSTLEEAVGNSSFVFGTSRRVREYKFVYSFNDIKHLIVALASRQKISIIFGQEDCGLSAASINLCDSIFYLPANPDFLSYNLAMSVGITAFEIFNLVNELKFISHFKLAPRKEIDSLFDYLKEILSPTVNKKRIPMILFTLRRMAMRTHLTKSEVALIKGLLLKNCINADKNT
jgi:TrmH family RNA methyltransferase